MRRSSTDLLAKRGRVWRFSLAGCLGAVLAVGLNPAPAAAQQAGVLQELEASLVGVIDRCERSVVSITRYAEAPQLAAGGAAQDPLGAFVPQPRILVPGRQLLPGALGQLQQVAGPPALASGAGVVIDPAGLVLTQFGVVNLGESHVVTDVEGVRYEATLRAADSRSGLAVLALSKRLVPGPGDNDPQQPLSLPALEVGEAETLRKGRLVVAIGNPFAIESDGQPTASWGSITNTAAKLPADEDIGGQSASDGVFRKSLHHFGSLIQTDARLGWNASGGALVTLDGKLVGVTTSASAIAGHEQPAGYAIPLNGAMRRAVKALTDGREPEYGLLGVSFNQGVARSPRTGRVGIEVGDAYPGGPAQIAGLATGDLLVAVEGTPIRSSDGLQLLIGSLPPGKPVDVAIERNGELQTVAVSLGKAYVEEGQIVTRRPPSWRGLRVDFATAVPPDVLREKSREGALDPGGCVVVAEVEPGSVSWESGVRPYAYVSHVGGERVRTPAEFYEAVKKAADNVKLKFTRPLTAASPEAAVN